MPWEKLGHCVRFRPTYIYHDITTFDLTVTTEIFLGIENLTSVQYLQYRDIEYEIHFSSVETSERYGHINYINYNLKGYILQEYHRSTAYNPEFIYQWVYPPTCPCLALCYELSQRATTPNFRGLEQTIQVKNQQKIIL